MAGFVILEFVAVAQPIMKALVGNVGLFETLGQLFLKWLTNALV